MKNYDIKYTKYPNTLGNVVRYGSDLYLFDGQGYCKINKSEKTEINISVYFETIDRGTLTPSFQVLMNGIEIFPVNESYREVPGGFGVTASLSVYVGAVINVPILNGVVRSGSQQLITNFSSEGSEYRIIVQPTS